jgi:hypothetical protein
MQVSKLPNTVLQSWGSEAASDFAVWLTEQFSSIGLDPQIQISPFIARQKINVLMLERVSNLLLAGEPNLRQDVENNWVWRVPIYLTFPSHGRAGFIGEIEIDAHYGEIRYNEDLLNQFASKADEVAKQVLNQRP